MATKSDGKVIISTELDNSNIPAGVKEISGKLGGLKSVVKSLGTAIGAAFSVMAIVNFAKESVQAANALSDALTGLRSILDGQGRSFSDAQKFLEDYTADGLIPMTNAITAYKNLASRGYDDSQIKSVMQALKDASAFGRQASYSMGDAVQSATEGLKNENSILVDNAGVTKNVAKMWEEYAASIGTTANNLTQEQKIQAEVDGILAESKYQTGDAAKVAGTLNGQLSQLSVNFNNLKVAVGNALTPIVQSFLPVINTAIAALTRFANAIASVVGALFGNASKGTASAVQSVADSYGNAASNAEELKDATTAAGKAAKAAKKSLAGFDEITKLSTDSSGGSAGSAVASGGTGATVPVVANADVEDNISPKIQALIDKVRALIEPLRQIDFTPAIEAFGRLQDAVAPITDGIFAGLEWAWNNIFVPFATWAIEDTIPVFLDLLSAALSVLNSVIEALAPMAIWLLDNFLLPIAEWTGGVIVSVINALTDALVSLSGWIEDNQELVQAMTVTVAAFVAAWGITDLLAWIINAGGLINILKGVASAVNAATIAKLADKAVDVALIALYALDYIKAFGGMIAKIAASTAAWVANTAAKVASTAAEWAQIAATTAWNAICATATAVTTAFGAAISFLTSPIGLVMIAVTALIAVIALLIANWDTVSQVASDVWDDIVEVWGGVCDWFDKTILTPLANGFKSMVNGVIGFINGLISGVQNGINALITAINKISFTVPDWIPGIGGSTLGFKLQKVSYPKIPYLAKGAVLPANKPFMAVVGDQKHGTNIEAPLATIQEAVAIVMEDMIQSNIAGHEATVAVLREILEAVLGIEIDGETISRAVDRYKQKMAVSRGG